MHMIGDLDQPKRMYMDDEEMAYSSPHLDNSHLIYSQNDQKYKN